MEMSGSCNMKMSGGITAPGHVAGPPDHEQKRELDRAQLMLLIRERRRTQAQVAEQLGLTVRQVERLYQAYKAGGAPALVSKKRGRPSARRLSEDVRTALVALLQARYADFGPTLALEKLTEQHGARLSRETLRKWMMAAGLWLPRAQRRQRPHPPRYRRPCLGELVQIDGLRPRVVRSARAAVRAPGLRRRRHQSDHAVALRRLRVDVRLLRRRSPVHQGARQARRVLQRQGQHLPGQRPGAPVRTQRHPVRPGHGRATSSLTN
jgi:Homeodomain-like domain